MKAALPKYFGRLPKALGAAYSFGLLKRMALAGLPRSDATQ